MLHGRMGLKLTVGMRQSDHRCYTSTHGAESATRYFKGVHGSRFHAFKEKYCLYAVELLCNYTFVSNSDTPANVHKFAHKHCPTLLTPESFFYT